MNYISVIYKSVWCLGLTNAYNAAVKITQKLQVIMYNNSRYRSRVSACFLRTRNQLEVINLL